MQNPGELRKFVAPEYIFGVGARRMAGQYASNLGGRKMLVVTDPGVRAAGWTQDVLACDIPPLARQAIHDPCLITNPRRAAQRDIEVLYEEAL